MGRFISPVLFIVIGCGVFWWNDTHTDGVLLFPLIDTIFPSLQGDLAAQGRATGFLWLAIGAMLLVAAALRRPPKD